MGIGLSVSVFLLAMLFVILAMLLIDERRLRATKAPDGRLTGFWDGKERRVSVRIDAYLKARYAVENTPREKTDTLSKNISLGGILMELYEKLYPATLLILDIFLGDSEHPVMAKGEVVWIQEHRDLDASGRRMFDAGIRFVSMPPGDRERLDREIKTLIDTRHG